MDHYEKKKGKTGRGGRPRLSQLAMAAAKQLRSLPPARSAFSLYVTQDGKGGRFAVLERGLKKDSTFHIHLSREGRVPPNLPPDSTYVARNHKELESLLAMFSDHPELWSPPLGDAFDGSVPLDEAPEDAFPYEEDFQTE